jgi:hypothetical protein
MWDFWADKSPAWEQERRAGRWPRGGSRIQDSPWLRPGRSSGHGLGSGPGWEHTEGGKERRNGRISEERLRQEMKSVIEMHTEKDKDGDRDIHREAQIRDGDGDTEIKTQKWGKGEGERETKKRD